MTLPREIYSVEAVRAIDRAAIDDAGINGYTLMTRAAEATLRNAIERFPDSRRWQIVCGSGNNAGDGYVLARLAAHEGISMSVIALDSPEKLQGDAAIAYGDFAAEGGAHIDWQGELDEEATLLIDAILGSGLERDVTGTFAEAVRTMNAHPAPIVALDIPTGLHGDSGAVLGVAIKADQTTTFVGLKAGLFLGEGPAHCGEVKFADLGIPTECHAASAIEMQRIDDSIVFSALPPRAKDAHKGDFGHLLVVGGSPGMPGAISLCGEAALRSGAGRVTIATHPQHAGALAAARPELMVHGVEDASGLKSLLETATAIVIGPGLGQDDWGRAMFEEALGAAQPLVLDADALNLLAGDPQIKTNWILTPHPGEAARLLEISGSEVQKDRRQSVTDLQRRYGGVVVLKGAGTLVLGGGDTPAVCTAGNPGMASPGMGDVLAGVTGAMLAQGLTPETAAQVAVDVHARAGDLAAEKGERGLLASDLMPFLRCLVNP